MKELGLRRPNNLHKKLAEVAADNRRAPSESEVEAGEAGVAEAKTLAQGVRH